MKPFLYLCSKSKSLDKILLLPDAIANQIAAGEVIQRPASVVKELLENAVDAGATKVQLSISNAGKQSIMVIDNGSGMSENDARMAFERHATSKIKQADDLFALHTMGFRGEALASIAAVAQVTLRTKLQDAEIGYKLQIDNSKLISKSAEVMPAGTQLEIRNLFFSVPARRKFLKSNTTELKHIVDEFHRVALAFPEVHFEFHNENKLLINLEAGNLKTRVLGILGQNWNSKLVPVKEDMDYLQIEGYVGKPDKAIKTRANQYFIVNNRYIRSPYLHHAIQRAFEGLIDKDEHPAYVLKITTKPDHIDINVHPTKQEIKFEDEKLVYSFLHSAVKHALGRFSVAPSLDFSLDATISGLESINRPMNTELKNKTINDRLFQTFTNKNEAHRIHQSDNAKQWQAAMDFHVEQSRPADTQSAKAENLLLNNFYTTVESDAPEPTLQHAQTKGPLQFNKKFIITPLKSGLAIIRQHEAHIRVLFDQLTTSQNHTVSQTLAFPVKMEFNVQDLIILESIIAELLDVGFDIQHFGSNEYIIHAVPAAVDPLRLEEVIETIVSDSGATDKFEWQTGDRLRYILARTLAISPGQSLTDADMEELISGLFSSGEPSYTPRGERIFVVLDESKMDLLF